MRWLKELRSVAAAGLLALGAGCESTSPGGGAGTIHASQLDEMGYQGELARIPDERVERLKHDLRWPVESEAVRPERLEWIANHARWYVEDQARDLERNAEGAGRLLGRDLERADNELLRDAADWWRMLWAHPDERIPRHAARMFY